MTTTTQPVKGKPDKSPLPPSLVTSQEDTSTSSDDAAVASAEDADDKVRPERGGDKPAARPVLQKMRNDEDQNLVEYLKKLVPDGTSVKISIERISPEKHFDTETQREVDTKGFLATVGELIDEAQISAKYGGGHYRLKIMTQTAKGDYKYAAVREVHIAGDPNTRALTRKGTTGIPVAPVPSVAPENPTAVKEAMSVLKDTLERERERADKATGFDHRSVTEAVRLAIDPMQRQIDALMQQLRDKDALIAQMQAAPKTDAFRDKLLDDMMKTEGGRLDALRIQHESELRALKESFAGTEGRLRDQQQRDRDEERRQHDRMLDSVKQSYEMQMSGLRQTGELALSSLKTSTDTQITLLRDRISNLETTNSELRTEIKDLRAKKDKGPLESLKEVKELKEALDIDDDKDEGLADKLAGLLTDPAGLEAIGSIVGKIRPAQAAQQTQQQAAPQNGQMIEGQDGQKYVFLNGKWIPVKKKKGTPKQVADSTNQQATTGGEEETTEPQAPKTPEISEEVMSDVVHKLELFFHNQTPPEKVAEMAIDQVPPEVIDAIRSAGSLDALLAKVGKLSSKSPFARQDGRNWLRKLGKAILGE